MCLSYTCLSFSPIIFFVIRFSLPLSIVLCISFFLRALSSLPPRSASAGPFFKSVQFLPTITDVTTNFPFVDKSENNFLVAHNARRKRKREKEVSIDRRGRAKKTRRGTEWEDARLLEEGRNWGDDPPGERNPETSRARDLSSCEGAALFVHDVRVSALSFCAPLAPTPVLAAPRTPLPSPLLSSCPSDASPRATLSFSLVYPPPSFSPTLREIRRRGETLPGR